MKHGQSYMWEEMGGNALYKNVIAKTDYVTLDTKSIVAWATTVRCRISNNNDNTHTHTHTHKTIFCVSASSWSSCDLVEWWTKELPLCCSVTS
jgi:hypothetical protein